MANPEHSSSQLGEATEPQKVFALLGGSSASVGTFISQRLLVMYWRRVLKESSDSAVTL